MRLTRYTDYALRTLIFLGLAERRLSSIRDIAHGYGISENHLMKVAHQLGVLGFIETVRGRNGGLRLARPPGDIRIGDVVRLTEEDLVLLECFGGDNTCRITENCVLRRAVGEALSAFLSILDRYSLQDLLSPGAKLADPLGLPLMQPKPVKPDAGISNRGLGPARSRRGRKEKPA
jgi:Rrf2 family nitric oxide-sensitive transcriptional repressor